MSMAVTKWGPVTSPAFLIYPDPYPWGRVFIHGGWTETALISDRLLLMLAHPTPEDVMRPRTLTRFLADEQIVHFDVENGSADYRLEEHDDERGFWLATLVKSEMTCT